MTRKEFNQRAKQANSKEENLRIFKETFKETMKFYALCLLGLFILLYLLTFLSDEEDGD